MKIHPSLLKSLVLLWLVAALGVGRRGAAVENAVDRPAEVVAQVREQRAVVFGSSSVRGSLGRIIEADLEKNGYEVSRVGVSSSGLARPDFRDMQARLEKMDLDERTAAVFVYLGVNDGQSLWLRPSERQRSGERWLRWNNPRWPQVYLRRAQRLYETICQRHVRRAIVLLPAQVDKPRLERRLQRIRKLQWQAAKRTSCATAISTVGERGRFVVDGKPTRLPDGFHMTALGARMVWERVVQRASLAVRCTWACPGGRELPLVL